MEAIARVSSTNEEAFAKVVPEEHCLHIHAKEVRALKFAPNDGMLAAGCDDGSIHLYLRMQKGKYERKKMVSKDKGVAIKTLDWCADGTLVRATTDKGGAPVVKRWRRMLSFDPARCPPHLAARGGCAKEVSLEIGRASCRERV